jgi:L-rhamnose-H+ transport protein
MNPNPFLGVVYHWIGGFASATNFIPFRGIKRWSWEIYWLIQGFAAWIVAPLVLGFLFIPHLFGLIQQVYASDPHALQLALLFGICWGVGGITFGLAIRYLGIALGYAIALGLCAAFGTIVPPIAHGQFGAIITHHSGQIVLLGVAICVLGVAVNGAAGVSKDKEFTFEEKQEAGEQDFNFGRGVAIAILAGFMSSFFAFGLDAGRPLVELTKTNLIAAGHSDALSNLPILVIVLWGGFITNFIWSAVLIVKNGSASQFVGTPGLNPMRATPTSGNTMADFDPEDPEYSETLSLKTLFSNDLFAALAGVIWYFQFFFYSMGTTKMGKYEFSSWTLHMASIIIFATLWGIFLKEWKGTSKRTKGLVAAGLTLLIGSTVVVGWGTYLQTVLKQ